MGISGQGKSSACGECVLLVLEAYEQMLLHCIWPASMALRLCFLLLSMASCELS